MKNYNGTGSGKLQYVIEAIFFGNELVEVSAKDFPHDYFVIIFKEMGGLGEFYSAVRGAKKIGGDVLGSGGDVIIIYSVWGFPTVEVILGMIADMVALLDDGLE